MDSIINVLLLFEKDDFGAWKRFRILGPVLLFHHKHDKSLEIADAAVSNVSSSVWQITSSTEEDQCYFIEKINTVCSLDLCFDK